MRIGIRAKLTVAMLVATLVPLTSFWAVNYISNKDRVEAVIKEKLAESSARSIQKLNDWTDTNDRMLKTAVEIPNIGQLVETDPNAVKGYLAAVSDRYPWMRGMFVTDITGQQIVGSNKDALIKVGDRQYFKDAVQGKFGVQLLVSRQTFKPALRLAHQLKTTDGNGVESVYGLISSSIDPEPIAKEIIGNAVGNTGYRFIMTDEGKLLAHFNTKEVTRDGNDKLADYTKHPMWKEASKTQTGAKFKTFNYEGKDYIGVIEKSKIGWYVVSVQTSEEAYAPMADLQQQAVIVLVLAVGLIGGFALFFGNAIARPIVKLTQVADDISKGKFESEAELDQIKSTDEIGVLAQSVKRLYASVQVAMESLADSDDSKPK